MFRPIPAARRPRRRHAGAPAAPFPAIERPTIRFAVRIVANSSAFTLGSLGLVEVGLARGQIVPPRAARRR